MPTSAERTRGAKSTGTTVPGPHCCQGIDRLENCSAVHPSTSRKTAHHRPRGVIKRTEHTRTASPVLLSLSRETEKLRTVNKKWASILHVKSSCQCGSRPRPKPSELPFRLTTTAHAGPAVCACARTCARVRVWVWWRVLYAQFLVLGGMGDSLVLQV
jgi:hypothetical protein